MEDSVKGRNLSPNLAVYLLYLFIDILFSKEYNSFQKTPSVIAQQYKKRIVDYFSPLISKGWEVCPMFIITNLEGEYDGRRQEKG